MALSGIAGCSTFGSSGVTVSMDNDDSTAHSVAVEVQRQDGETLFDREVTLAPEASRTFEDALPNPSDAETLVADVTVDGTTTTREFQIGGATGTSELVVNVKRDGEVTVFVAQS
jgi:hypothetical protein